MYWNCVHVLLSDVFVSVISTLTRLSACVDGDVMLINNTEPCIGCNEGTVVVCYNNNYGTVCDDFWDELDARVVCDQLEFTNGGKSPHPLWLHSLSHLSITA